MLGKCITNVRNNVPLVHNITNYVTVNDVANVLLACGGSPPSADVSFSASASVPPDMSSGISRLIIAVILPAFSHDTNIPIIPQIGLLVKRFAENYRFCTIFQQHFPEIVEYLQKAVRRNPVP